MFNDLAEDQNSESAEQEQVDLLDPFVLHKLQFHQRAEKKNWQGIKVEYSGIPGNITLERGERMTMFPMEMHEMQAAEKVLDIFREFIDIINGSIGVN